MFASFIGLTFPFQKNQASFPAYAVDSDLIKQSLTQIILVVRGERVMRPTAGSNCITYVFQNNNEILAEIIRGDLGPAIAQQEPRVMVTSISVQQNTSQQAVATSQGTVQPPASVTTTVNYIVILTKQPGTVSVTTPVSTPQYQGGVPS